MVIKLLGRRGRRRGVSLNRVALSGRGARVGNHRRRIRLRWKSEGDQRVGENVAKFVPTASRDDDKLLARLFSEKSHRTGVTACRKFRDPDLVSGVLVKGTEAAVIGCADKDQPPCGDERSPYVRGAGGGQSTFDQFVDHAENASPSELTGIEIDGGEESP